jgi:hypothetical protein
MPNPSYTHTVLHISLVDLICTHYGTTIPIKSHISETRFIISEGGTHEFEIILNSEDFNGISKMTICA